MGGMAVPVLALKPLWERLWGDSPDSRYLPTPFSIWEPRLRKTAPFLGNDAENQHLSNLMEVKD